MPILKHKFFALLAILAVVFSFIPSQSKALTYNEIAAAQSGKVLGDSTATYSYPSGSLVNENGTIYFISGTIKVPFTSWQAFIGLGYSLRNVINGNLQNYTPSTNYFITTANAEHPWGSWLLYNGTVYYSTQQGLIPVPSWAVFLNNGGQAKYIVNANKYDVNILNSNSKQPLMSFNDGRIFAQPQAPNPVVNTSPNIDNLSLMAGPVGTPVTITGSGFSATGNVININNNFGGEDWAGFDFGSYTSSDGKTLNFVIPAGNGGGDPGVAIVPGSYNILVKNTNGASNIKIFTVTESEIPLQQTVNGQNQNSSVINSIIVTSPKEGDIWKTGATNTIEWYFNHQATSTNPSKVNIYLQTVYEVSCTPPAQTPCYQTSPDLGALIAEKIDNSGSFDWDMPNDMLLPGKYYKIAIIDSSLATQDNYQSNPSLSNSFSVIRNPDNSQFITLTYPVDSATWAYGTDQTVSFRYSKNISALNISLKTNCSGILCVSTSYILAYNYTPQNFLAQLNDEQIASLTFTLGVTGTTFNIPVGSYYVKVTDISGKISTYSKNPIIITR